MTIAKAMKKNKLNSAIKKLKAIKPSALVDELFKPSSIEVLACIERDQLADFEKLLMKFRADGFKGNDATPEVGQGRRQVAAETGGHFQSRRYVDAAD
jgi:hypothetical protein